MASGLELIRMTNCPATAAFCLSPICPERFATRSVKSAGRALESKAAHKLRGFAPATPHERGFKPRIFSVG